MAEQSMLWVPVKEKMPDDGEAVVAIVPYGDGEFVFRIAWWTSVTDRWTLITSIGFEHKPMDGVSYWFRLPLLPDEYRCEKE